MSEAMRFDGDLHFNESCWIDGWWTIEDSRGQRINGADIEGDAADMLGMADAIERRVSFSARRCAVRFESGRALLCSPRNSTVATSVTLAAVDGLAKQIRTWAKVAPNSTTPATPGGGDG